MEFTLDSKTLISHLVLEDFDISQKIAKTPKWTDDEIMEAKLTINGVDIPAQMLEDLLQEMWKQATTKANDSVDADKFNQRVEQKALAIIKVHADGLIESMCDLQNTLGNAEDLITPYWERDNKTQGEV